MKIWLKNLKITLIIIGTIQIIGGITGLGLIAWLLLKTGSITGPVLLIYLVGLSLFIFSIYCGRSLFSKTGLKLGLVLSMINMLLQIIHFQINGNGITYSSGINLAVGLENAFKIDFGLITSVFQMSIGTDDTTTIFKVNLAAIFLIWILLDIYFFNFKNIDAKN
jgi:hypothetical protein